jgi:hypothetical protein
MTGQINVNKIAARTGNTITVNSGDKISGAAGSIIAPGMILQTVQSSTTTYFNTTSSSFANAFTATVTPTLATSKIMIIGSMCGISNNGGGANVEARLNRNLSGDTVVGKYNRICHISGGTFLGVTHNFTEIDSPNTTSTITYEYQMRTQNGTNSVRFCDYHTGTADSRSTLTFIEIAQ